MTGVLDDRERAVVSPRGWGDLFDLRRWGRYATVSIAVTVLSQVVLATLVATRTTSPAWANVIATAVGVGPSFELNRRWVWKAESRSSQVVAFVALSFAGLVVSTVAVAVVGAWADVAGLSTTMRTLVVQLASLGAFGVVWLVQFVVLDRVLFRDRIVTV